ncbi:phage tail protein I [Phaeobacter sp. JH85H1]|uniref:phage tail protein I n=1 Tax=unclassified Phaeobacter TaxID=2621772 RepID=UPI003A847F31
MSESLLPHNATVEERALEAVIRAGLLPPVPLRAIWDPDTCPVELLPWLAFAFSVDEWDPSWGEAAKREVVRQSVQVHRRKGTVGAVKRALQAIGTPAEIIEWFEDGSAPFTFKVWLDLRAMLRNGADLPAELVKLRRAIDAAKPVRSHYTAHARVTGPAPVYCGAFATAKGVTFNTARIPDAPPVALQTYGGAAPVIIKARLGNSVSIPDAPDITAFRHYGMTASGRGYIYSPILEAPA